MNRNEQEYYANINGIARALDRIANALENQNQFVVNTIKGQNNKEDKIYYKTRKDMFMDNPCTKEEYDAAKQDRIQEQEELDTQHDYLHQLVRNLSGYAYKEFCNEHCLPTADAVAVSNYITDLDYDECLGIISDLESSNDLSIRYKNKIKEFPKSDDQANEDAIELDFNIDPIQAGDYDLRETARMYTEELKAGNFNTKKECILDYITNEFGSHGARYTDIIKFAYYLGAPNARKFNSTDDRGYYSCAISGRNAHLIRGGKDFLVKGINKEGDERYFAHSFVESVTDYWKHI